MLLDAQQRIAELESKLAAQDAEIAAKDARIRELEQQVATLMAQVEALTKQVAILAEKLGQNSRNSHLPPSSDPPGSTGSEKSSKGKSQRKRGGQRGHRGTRRDLLPADQVDELVDLYPDQCEDCWVALEPQPDPKAKRYQVTEVPPIQPHTTEYRRHAVTCACGHTTRAAYDEDTIPASPFGPRLMSVIA
ncbi:MAG: DUF6444 domain-containing protein, partial [Steroidobacteraceae bacterium]